MAMEKEMLVHGNGNSNDSDGDCNDDDDKINTQEP